jgi:putative transposase
MVLELQFESLSGNLDAMTNGKAIGLDVGLIDFCVTSDGSKYKNPRHLKKHSKNLKRKQQKLSRKQPGSNTRNKARKLVAKVHSKIQPVREDFLHKLSRKIVNENQVIAVEDLSVKNMLKNHKLALSISDSAWGELTRQLEYKCEWYGRTFVKIDRWFPSSKRCGHCGHIVDKLPLKIREWNCPKCGTHHDRDVNAAKNILAAGLAVNVCGATVRPEQSKSVKAGAMKQKPRS